MNKYMNTNILKDTRVHVKYDDHNSMEILSQKYVIYQLIKH